VQKTLLAAERPDLMVFSGDQVSGWECHQPACQPGWFAARWRQLIAPVHEAGVPYAIILGNHDDEADLTRRRILDLDIHNGGPLSLTRQGPSEASGASNYFLDIQPPACDPPDSGGSQGSETGTQGASNSGGPAARIWLLDSGDHTCPPLMVGW
jgi:pre-mRNA-splicing factor SYF1